MELFNTRSTYIITKTDLSFQSNDSLSSLSTRKKKFEPKLTL
jgi:hypothetical protein